MTPYYSDESVTIYHGDCREVLPTLGTVDAIITDPPYSSGGMYRADRAAPTTAKYQISHETFRRYAAFAGDNRDQRSFEKWVDGWASQCLRLVPSGGGIGVFIDWRNVACVVDAIQVAGWVYRGLTPWHKGTDLRPLKGWFRRNIEFVVWGSAGPLLTGPIYPGRREAGGAQGHRNRDRGTLLRDRGQAMQPRSLRPGGSMTSYGSEEGRG